MALDGKVAVVTGASRGIGRAYLTALADAGANVVGLARSFGPGSALPVPGPSPAGLPTTEVTQNDDRPLRLACDVENEASVESTVAEVIEHFGRIDVLVNNAGMFPHHDPFATSVEDFDRMLRVNVLGVYLMMRAVLPHMLRQGSGSIVNMSSGAALPTERGSAGHVDLMAYAVSKAAVDRVTTFFGEELRPTGIAVNGLRPGGVLTDTWRDVAPKDWEKALTEGFGQRCVPEVVGPPMLYLAQQSAETMTARVVAAKEYGVTWP